MASREEARAVASPVAERTQRAVDAARGLLVGLSRLQSVLDRDGPPCTQPVAPLQTR